MECFCGPIGSPAGGLRVGLQSLRLFNSDHIYSCLFHKQKPHSQATV